MDPTEYLNSLCAEHDRDIQAFQRVIERDYVDVKLDCRSPQERHGTSLHPDWRGVLPLHVIIKELSDQISEITVSLHDATAGITDWLEFIAMLSAIVMQTQGDQTSYLSSTKRRIRRTSSYIDELMSEVMKTVDDIGDVIAVICDRAELTYNITIQYQNGVLSVSGGEEQPQGVLYEDIVREARVIGENLENFVGLADHGLHYAARLVAWILDLQIRGAIGSFPDRVMSGDGEEHLSRMKAMVVETLGPIEQIQLAAYIREVTDGVM